MNRIFTALFSSVFIIAVFLFTVLTACKKDAQYNETTKIQPCNNVVCLNGGVCVDGYCKCPEGFEGLKCETRWNEKFVGIYTASDECLPVDQSTYPVEILPQQNNAGGLLIKNLGKFCPDRFTIAKITPEKTAFNIPMQNICEQLYVSGNGNINDKFVNIFIHTRDSINHTSSYCSIKLGK